MQQQLQKIMASFDEYPPRPVQSETYAGPLSITRFRTIEQMKKLMKQKADRAPEIELRKEGKPSLFSDALSLPIGLKVSAEFRGAECYVAWDAK